MAQNLRREILMGPLTDNEDLDDEDLVQRRQNVLLSCLALAKPVHGQGFFNVNRPMITSIIGAATTYIVVLVQFNMSEKPDLQKFKPIANDHLHQGLD